MTDPETWKKIKEIVGAALERPPIERTGYLDEACARNATLRAEVESLLAAHLHADDLSRPAWSAPAVGGAVPAVPGDAGGPPPGTIGPYRLVEALGEGGMGQVWLAEQTAPVQRTVALKLIKRGLLDASVLRRFESERQSLAIMDHPAIAKVLDAGSTPEGQPYFVMEYVPGIPITEYCDRKRLPIRERLELFRKACDGVQHAHLKAVIHRDLKPANILVTEIDDVPMPRIIDFGLAKAAAPRAAMTGGTAESAPLTQVGGLLGTPGYMSPEQADPGARDIDSRTDVYSLGVILYELLTGSLPLDMSDWSRRPLEDSLRRLREEEPPRPSARAAAVRSAPGDRAATRGTEPRRWAGLLRGDLDWIVMKAIEKDRARRYESPGALAADVGRFLRDEPVSAGPPTALYRLRKLVRRHRLAASASALVAIAVLLGLALALWGLVQARRSEARARGEAEAAQQTAAFLIDLFQVSRPEQAKGRTITAREVLDRGAERVRTRLRGQPALQARMMSTIGQVYGRLALYDEAEPLLEESLATERRLFGDDHPTTLDAMAQLALLRSQKGEFDGVEETLRKVLESRRRQGGDDAPTTLAAMGQLAVFLQARGRLTESEALYREVLGKRRRAPGADRRDLYDTMNGLASLLQDKGHGSEAESLYREAEAGQRKELGADDPDRLLTQSDLATLLVSQGKLTESETIFRDLIEIDRRIYGPDHPETLTNLNNLGVVLSMEGKLDQAEPLYREALERRRRVLGDDHPDTIFSIHNMGGLLADRGKYQEAERYRREAWERRKRVLGTDHPDTLEAEANLGIVLYQLGRLPEAESMLRGAVEGRRRVLGAEHADTLGSLADLSVTLLKEGRIDQAAAAYREVLAGYKKTLGAEDPQIGITMSRLGDCLGIRGASDEAESLLIGGFEILDRARPPVPASRREAVQHIIEYYDHNGRRASAEAWRAKL